jgi:prophage regulatory protein
MHDVTVRAPLAHKSLRLIRLREVMHLCGLGRTSIYAFVKNGSFPGPISIGTRAVAWTSDSIENWIESRIKASGGAA